MERDPIRMDAKVENQSEEPNGEALSDGIHRKRSQ
jgi:hypothetical protein